MAIRIGLPISKTTFIDTAFYTFINTVFQIFYSDKNFLGISIMFNFILRIFFINICISEIYCYSN